MEKRTMLVLKELIHTEGVVNIGELSSALATTSKTISNDMDLIDHILRNFGAQIVSKQGLGYQLEVFDKNEFEIFKQCLYEKYLSVSTLSYFSMDRVEYILHRLLFEEDYLKSFVLAEELFISQTTLSNDLKRVKAILKEYHLQLTYKPSHGMRVTGNEQHLRLIMSKYLFLNEENHTVLQRPSPICLDTLQCTNLVVKILHTYGLSLASRGVEELVALLAVSKYRYHSGFKLLQAHEELEEAAACSEYAAARKLAKCVLETEQDEEIAALTIFLASRASVDVQKEKSCGWYRSTLRLVDEMLQYLLLTTDIDLVADDELRMLLVREMRAMHLRIRYGLEYHNWHTAFIKEESVVFEYALLISEFLSTKFDHMVSEPDISILAQCLYASLNRRSSPRQRKNVIYVFMNGRSVSTYFHFKIMRRLGEYIGSVNYRDFYGFQEELSSDDLIITDLPRSKFLSSKEQVFQLRNGLDEEELRLLRNILSRKHERMSQFLNSFSDKSILLQAKVRDRWDAIELLADQMKQVYHLGDDFGNLVIRREKMSTTEHPGNFAIISSIFPTSNETVCGLMTLKKAILWDQEYVQCVVMVSYGRDGTRTIMNAIQKMLGSHTLIHRILHSGTPKEVKENLECMFSQMDTRPCLKNKSCTNGYDLVNY